MQIEEATTIAQRMIRAAENASIPLLGERDLLEKLGEVEPVDVTVEDMLVEMECER
jgi:type III secretion system FlhB-like substrate exporter